MTGALVDAAAATPAPAGQASEPGSDDRLRRVLEGVVGVAATQGNRVDVLRLMMIHSATAPLGEVLFDDLELWDAPPADR